MEEHIIECDKAKDSSNKYKSVWTDDYLEKYSLLTTHGWERKNHRDERITRGKVFWTSPPSRPGHVLQYKRLDRAYRVLCVDLEMRGWNYYG